MRSLLSMVRRTSFGESLDQVEDAFETLCASGETSLEEFWKTWSRLHPASTTSLAALVKLDIQRRFDRGERPKVAEYLERFPSLRESKERVVSLVYEEFCLRGELGEEPDSQEFCDEYAPWRDSLLSQLAYHRDLNRAMEADSSPCRFPEVGDRFDKYTLDRVLGSGAIARVYLATDDELGGRKLVIKVSASFGQEPRIMGQLNHRNIVPILTFARSDSGLRGICMPYRPGVTLDELIKKIGRESPPRNARALWELIRSDESQESLPQEDRHSGWDDFPIDGTFAEAVVWIGLALSDALEYLHSQPVLHRDIKPANILLAYQEGPMLLDFNLSQKPGTPETVSASMKGGTLPYMAPEHLHAFLEVSGWQDVDRPADLYSLGLVLRELLTGTEPELPDAKLSLPRAIRGLIYSRSRPRASTRELNPLIPPSLDSILAKCLEFEPAHRYASAADLSLDLRRFLERRPLASAPNPSRAERGANWIYRNRRFLGSLALFCVFVFGFLLLRTPNSIPDRSDFRRAENQLESTKPADWEKARETFLRIRRDRPDSAWPVIYLALALDKIDSKKKSEEVSSLLRQACDQPDVEVVFRSTLRKEPGSLLMLMNYGLLLIKLNRDAEAWGYLQRALVIDRDQIMALSALIKLEKDSKHYERAVELGRKAISLGLEFNLGRSKIYSFRYQMLASLLKLTENTIENGKNSTDRAQAARLLNEIDSTLTAMTDDLSKTPTGQGTNIHLYIVPFYRGTVASGRAILASDNHDFERARTLFDDANHWFQVASEKLSESDVNNLETYRSAIKIQRELMELRQARFQKNLKIGPHN